MKLIIIASPARSEVGRTRENTPDGTAPLSRPKKSNLDASTIEKPQGSIRLNLKASYFDRPGENASPAPVGFTNSTPSSLAPFNKRLRPETSHQKAVNLNRRMHIDKILFKKWKQDTILLRRKRKHGLNPLYQQIKHTYFLDETYDSEEEDSFGPGGITLCIPFKGSIEQDDFGGNAHHYKKVLQRSIRRLARDDGIELTSYEFMSSAKPQQTNGTKAPTKPRPRPVAKKSGSMNPAKISMPADDLDDLDMDLLGEGQDDTVISSGADSDDAELTEDDFSYADPYATVK